MLLLLAVAMVFGFSVDTFAQRGRNGSFNNRADRQRIRQGIRSGRITRDEARILRERQQQIRGQRRVYRSDGVLTSAERREIRRNERQHDRLIRESRRNSNRSVFGRTHRRGDGYYRRGAGSPTHPVFGNTSRNRRRRG